jgi:hypothetical protein
VPFAGSRSFVPGATIMLVEVMHLPIVKGNSALGKPNAFVRKRRKF